MSAHLLAAFALAALVGLAWLLAWAMATVTDRRRLRQANREAGRRGSR